MAYESETRRHASQLSDAARNARNERNKVNAQINNSRQWWKGKAAEAFTQNYNRIDGEANRFFRSIDNAVNNMNRLPSLIDRAERERRE